LRDERRVRVEQQRQKNWFSRNWKWFVPAACVGALVLFVVFALSIMSFVFGIMKSSEPYKVATTRAAEHPVVQQAVGTPMKTGWLFSGNINVTGSTGHADLAIPFSGPKGKAKIYVVAEKEAGEWVYSTLEVEVAATGQRIALFGHDDEGTDDPYPDDEQ
jgi:hypothetical protein